MSGEGAAVGAVGIFSEVVFVAELVMGESDGVHGVIVGGLAMVEAVLSDLLGDFQFFAEIIAVGIVDDGVSLAGLPAGFVGDVAVPDEGVAVLQGVIGDGHEFVERDIIKVVVKIEVIINFEAEFFVEGMMSK